MNELTVKYFLEMLNLAITSNTEEFINKFEPIIKPIIILVIKNNPQLLSLAPEPRAEYLTYKEIEKEYKISISSLKKWRKEGILIPELKGGRSLLFERKHVKECLQNRPRVKPRFLTTEVHTNSTLHTPKEIGNCYRGLDVIYKPKKRKNSTYHYHTTGVRITQPNLIVRILL